MGQPKKLRKSYDTPARPYEKDRIDEENKIIKNYGLKNKKELWKADTKIKTFRTLARNLQGDQTEYKPLRENQLKQKLVSLGVIGEEAVLDDILSLKVTDILDRRLQTLVFKKGMANTLKQARQFIVHGHISINGRKINVPGYIVKIKEEGSIEYYGKPIELLTKKEVAMQQPVEEVKTVVPETKPMVPTTKPSIPTPGAK